MTIAVAGNGGRLFRQALDQASLAPLVKDAGKEGCSYDGCREGNG